MPLSIGSEGGTHRPGGIAEAAGVGYQPFSKRESVSLDGDPFGVSVTDNTVRWWTDVGAYRLVPHVRA